MKYKHNKKVSKGKELAKTLGWVVFYTGMAAAFVVAVLLTIFLALTGTARLQ